MKGIIVEKDGTIRLADDIPMPEPGPSIGQNRKLYDM